MLAPDDRWAYHQDERDRAANMGCFVAAAVLVCMAVLAISVIACSI